MGLFTKPGSSTAVKPKVNTEPQKRSDTQAKSPLAGTGIFKNVKKATPGGDGVYFKPGHYVLRLDITKADRDRKGILFCKIQGTVVAVIDDYAGQSLRVGDEVVQIPKQSGDFFDRDIHGFCSAVLGVDLEEMEDEAAEEAVEAIFCGNNPLAGFPVEVKAYNITLKDDSDFTKIKWLRCIPAAEMLELDEATQERFWPGGGLRRLAEAEASTQG